MLKTSRRTSLSSSRIKTLGIVVVIEKESRIENQKKEHAWFLKTTAAVPCTAQLSICNGDG